MEIVSLVRRGLAERLGRERYDLWFGRSVAFAWRDGKIVISAADQFLLERLRNRLRADLLAVCRGLLGDDVELDFVVASDLEIQKTEVPGSEPGGMPEQSGNGSTGSGDRRNDRVALENGSQSTADAARAVKSDAFQLKVVTPGRPGTTRRRFHTLETFVSGSGNRVAQAAVQMVLDRFGAVSPLLIYGPSGCGKTHLLEALLMRARQQGMVRRSVMISAEQFTTHFLESLQGSGLPNFRRKYRDVELLLIDDVQFFAGKRATLVELQHTLDTVLRAGKQVVLVADRSPANMRELGPELVTRMTGGLVCGIEAADYETRLGIARQAARGRQIEYPPEVLELIARECSGDARQIFGALNRLEVAQRAAPDALTVEYARAQLSDLLQAARKHVRLPDIEEAICEVYGLDASSLQREGKSRELQEPRMLAMWLARRHTRAAFAEIGQYFGGRSHSSVIAAQKRMSALLAARAATRHGAAHPAASLEDLLRRIEQRLRTG